MGYPVEQLADEEMANFQEQEGEDPEADQNEAQNGLLAGGSGLPTPEEINECFASVENRNYRTF